MSDILSGVDETARSSWVERILAAADPGGVLLQALEELDGRQDLRTQAALFESVLWRADVRHYWVYFRMTRVYAELGRPEAGFFTACLAVQMNPDWLASEQPFRHLFTEFARRGESQAALEVFHRQIGYFPERPIAQPHEVESLFRGRPEEAPPPAPAPIRLHPLPTAMRREHRVVEAQTRAPTPIRAVAGALPPGLAKLAGPMRRAEIDVAELPDADLLICNNAVAVRDADGALQIDLSVASYPELIARRVLEPGDAGPVETREEAEAVLLLDAFPPPNLGHFLLDQVARLELYRHAGADLDRALVVTPPLKAPFQHEIMARAGVRRSLGTDRVIRLRAGRLWVSTDCRALQHPAHLGADWSIEHARRILGGRGGVGRRRLYLSRADAPSRRVLNQSALAEELARHGFETIVPGRLGYAEQLAAFREASHIVAPHGAALAHLVLCPPGARVLELFHPLYGTWAYAMIATACGLDYAAHAGRDGVSDAPELNDPALVDLAAGRFGERHIRVDPLAVRAWLEQA